MHKKSKFMYFELYGTVHRNSETVLIEKSFLRQLAKAIKLWRISLTDVFRIYSIAQKL